MSNSRQTRMAESVAIALAIGFTAAFAAHAWAADSAGAALQSASGSQVNGQVTFTQEGNGVRIGGEIRGLTPGAHGFHLHEKGDCTAADAESAGGHFNPTRAPHGGPDNQGARHAGDFGNIRADASGTAKIDMTVSGISVARDRPDSVMGKGVVVHAQADDQKSNPAGNSGARIACGVVK